MLSLLTDHTIGRALTLGSFWTIFWSPQNVPDLSRLFGIHEVANLTCNSSGKLSRLSLPFQHLTMQCTESESNTRHEDLQSPALPSELPVQLKVFRNSYNRIGGIISPNIMSTTITLTGQAVCLNFHLTRFWPLKFVPIEGIEPPYPNTWARLTILNVANIRCK